MLAGRHVVLGVSGGVAAYKTVSLARRLVERGAAVRTVMTESAVCFVGPPTLAAVTGRHPVIGLFDDEDVAPHITLGQWADVVVVAPATAATIARIAIGLSEDALSATVLATSAPVVIAPAMHTQMWEHPATQRNVATLEADGCHRVGPATGELAGGDEGVGRMAEPEEILEIIEMVVGPRPLAGWRVLVTAGGTREPIDPVRYIGNHSSGKMGNALAVEAARRGADVTLVTAAPAPAHPGIDVVTVDTAEELAEAAWSIAGGMDVAVMAAAVADFRPKVAETSKMRRDEGVPTLTLEPTPDVLAGIAAMDPRPFLVGFAAETGSLDEAAVKAERKGVDLLVGNDVTKEGSGFGSDTNEVVVITPGGAATAWPLLSKEDVAARLWDRIVELRSGSGAEL